jgi:tellurite resistance protein TerC
MMDALAWLVGSQFRILVCFHLFLALMLCLDLGLFRRKSHVVSLKEAAAWSATWFALALLFAAGLWKFWHLWHPGQEGQGSAKAVEFVTGYLVEQSLSVDNLFVFLVIFRYFGVPEPFRHRVLVWGILGAVVMRALFILSGAALLHWFAWAIYVFGAFLVYTGYKLTSAVDEEVDPGRNLLLRLARRFLPVVDDYQSPRFWVKRDGRWHATPLPLVLLVVESTDVLFAVDSIPAIFGITRDPFIVYTSNIFAIIGLRSLYFLLAGFLGMFRFLNYGLAAVLTFVGLKMIAEELFKAQLEANGIGQTHRIVFSLSVIALILAVSVAASLIAGPQERPETDENSPPKQ